MKNLILLPLMTISSLVYSQVGINTSNPKGILHIDGAEDNPAIGNPNQIEQLNDVIVTNTGNLGLGTLVPSEKIDIQGNARIRELVPGDNIENFPYAVVTKKDGTLGYASSSNVSIQSFQLKIPPHAQSVPDFNNHTNTAYDSDNWWVISKVSMNPASNIPARMTLVYEYRGSAFSNITKILPQLTTGNNTSNPDIFSPAFINIANIGGKTRLTVSISRTDNVALQWGGTFLLNTLFAIRN